MTVLEPTPEEEQELDPAMVRVVTDLTRLSLGDLGVTTIGDDGIEHKQNQAVLYLEQNTLCVSPLGEIEPEIRAYTHVQAYNLLVALASALGGDVVSPDVIDVQEGGGADGT